MSNLVSAIITTHNRPLLLKRAIESVLAQTYTNLECIVVDDNSTDNTKEICAGFPQVKYIHIPTEESRGGNYARNTGIKASTGDYIAFLDDDDYWLPEKIDKQISLIKNSSAGVIYCGRINENIISDKNRTLQKSQPNDIYRGDLSTKIFTSIPTTTSALLVDKNILEQVGLFDENLNYWQEYDLMIRLAQVTEFDFVNEHLLVYRIDKNDSNRLTNRYQPWKAAVEHVLDKHHSLIANLKLSDRLKFRRLIAGDAYLRVMNQGNNCIKYWVKIKYYYRILLCKLIK